MTAALKKLPHPIPHLDSKYDLASLIGPRILASPTSRRSAARTS